MLQEQPSAAMNSESPSTEATEAATQVTTTKAVETEALMTEEPTTKVPETEELTTEVPTTEEKTTEEKPEVTTEPRDEETTEEEPEVTTEPREEEITEEIDGTGFRIGIVTDINGINDGSFNQSAWEGMQRAAEDFGCEVDYLESKVESDYVPNIDTMLDEEYDLIILGGYSMAGALRDAAEMNPDQKFVITGSSNNSDLDNVTYLVVGPEEAYYLVGLIAGMTTETNNVGFVSGMIGAFVYSYAAGVLDANPDATIQHYNLYSYFDSAAAKTETINMISNGADIIVHEAGDSGLGVIEACKEKGVWAIGSRWAIGSHLDQSSQAHETILTSVVYRADSACYDTIKKAIKDELQSGNVVYDLSMGGVDIAPTTDNLSNEVLKAVEDAKQDIINGKIIIPKFEEEFKEKYDYELGDVW